MSKSSFEMPDIGTVFITKKRGQRTMRLRVDTKGLVRVSIPWLVPLGAAKDFIISKKDWIEEQQSQLSFKPYDGMLLGKTLKLKILENSRAIRPRQDKTSVIVSFPDEYDEDNPDHLEKIKKTITKALRTEAEKVLLPRLNELADLYGYEYESASVKQLVGRWGSCDSEKHIALSLYLVQLPIELIDYVLIHELTHTIHLNHSPSFWDDVHHVCPDYKELRRKMRTLQPRLYDAKTFMA